MLILDKIQKYSAYLKSFAEDKSLIEKLHAIHKKVTKSLKRA